MSEFFTIKSFPPECTALITDSLSAFAVRKITGKSLVIELERIALHVSNPFNDTLVSQLDEYIQTGGIFGIISGAPDGTSSPPAMVPRN